MPQGAVHFVQIKSNLSNITYLAILIHDKNFDYYRQNLISWGSCILLGPLINIEHKSHIDHVRPLYSRHLKASTINEDFVVIIN